VLNRLLLESAGIKKMSLPTSRTGMFLGIFAGKNQVKRLSAFVAANRHYDGEVPFYKRVVWRPDAELNHAGTVMSTGKGEQV
jgi:hypothetical protein